MLFKHNNRSAIQAVILTSLLSLLASCSNSAAIESLVSADPQLKEAIIGQQINTTKPQRSQDSAKKAAPITNAMNKPVAAPNNTCIRQRQERCQWSSSGD